MNGYHGRCDAYSYASFVIGLQNVYPAIVFEQLIKLDILPITFKHSIPNPIYLSHDYYIPISAFTYVCVRLCVYARLRLRIGVRMCGNN